MGSHNLCNGLRPSEAREQPTNITECGPLESNKKISMDGKAAKMGHWPTQACSRVARVLVERDSSRSPLNIKAEVYAAGPVTAKKGQVQKINGKTRNL